MDRIIKTQDDDSIPRNVVYYLLARALIARGHQGMRSVPGATEHDFGDEWRAIVNGHEGTVVHDTTLGGKLPAPVSMKLPAYCTMFFKGTALRATVNPVIGLSPDEATELELIAVLKRACEQAEARLS